MFRFFENLIDPFRPSPDDTPPAKLWPYLKSQYDGFGKLMALMAVSGVIVALIETSLIFYSGRVIDLMDGTDAQGFSKPTVSSCCSRPSSFCSCAPPPLG